MWTLDGIHCSECLIELCCPVVICCLNYFHFPFFFLCEESPSVTSRFARRTHTCGDLNEGIVGQEVHLCGWVELKRLGRFLTLRDGYGAAQLVAPNNVSVGWSCSECIMYQTVCSGSCLFHAFQIIIFITTAWIHNIIYIQHYRLCSNMFRHEYAIFGQCMCQVYY